MHKLVATAAALAVLASGTDARADTSPPTGWEAQDKVTLAHPEWARNAVLYQINTRQFTAEGTFAAAMQELPRLKELGVDILWLMPIHPIGAEHRKGTLGSPYSVQDYYAVNPEFGTEEDFRAFVDAAHAQGFKVILDLVANHTAWDNELAKQHPDWYEKDWKGDFRPTPWWDWSDIIDLDWSKPGVREHVGGAMEYWVREFGVDGYRADVAGYVPLDFWETARARLDAIKPVFMLGEVQQAAFHYAAFDATYAWDWHNTSKNVAKGKGNATSFYGYYAENESLWPRQAMRMTYIENHDSNAWEGTTQENYGAALDAMTVLSFTGEGLPLIHNGMEACNAKRLEFFERDPIDWGRGEDCAYGDLLQNLIAFRKANPALANGQWGGRMHKLETDHPEQVFAWVRTAGENRVVAFFNFGDKPVTVTPTSALADGTYERFGTPERVVLREGQELRLSGWGYLLLARN